MMDDLSESPFCQWVHFSLSLVGIEVWPHFLSVDFATFTVMQHVHPGFEDGIHFRCTPQALERNPIHYCVCRQKCTKF